jgi:hypothetical protein
LLGSAIKRTDQVGHREHEGEPRRDDGAADERGVAHELAGAVGVETIRDHGQLEPDQDEEGRVEEEDEDLPQSKALEPSLGRSDLRGHPAEIDAGSDRREHAREPELVRGDEGGVGGEQRDRQFGRRVVEPPPDLRDHEPHGEPDRDPAGRCAEKLEPRVERREASADCGGYGDPVGDEGRRVVHEALALHEVDDPAWRAEPAHDRRGSYGIGR